VTINVPPEYEGFIRQVVSSGAFKDAEEAIRRALQLLDSEQRAQSAAVQEQCGSEVDESLLPDDIDPLDLARMQGVAPIQNPDAGAADSWPPDESIDEWLADLQKLRGHGSPRQIS